MDQYLLVIINSNERKESNGASDINFKVNIVFTGISSKNDREEVEEVMLVVQSSNNIIYRTSKSIVVCQGQFCDGLIGERTLLSLSIMQQEILSDHCLGVLIPYLLKERLDLLLVNTVIGTIIMLGFCFMNVF